MAAAAPVKVSEDTLYAELYFSRLQEMITKAANVYEQAECHFYWTHHKWILNKDGVAIDLGPAVATTNITTARFSKSDIENQPDKVKDWIKGIYKDLKFPPIIPETNLVKTDCHITLFEAIKQ